MANRFSIEAIFKAVDRVSAPVTRMQNRVGKFTRGMGRGLTNLTRTTDKFARGIKRAGVATVASLALTGAAMGNVIKVGASFEDSLVRAAIKFPEKIIKGTEAFRELEEAARDVGRTTEFTGTQAAQGINFLAMAGFNAKSAIGSLSGVVDLATVANLDLGRATDIATDSMGAFKLLTKDATTNMANLERVSDVLALTSIRANTSIEDMFDAVVRGAPSATAAGQSIETTASMIAIMAGSGIKASRAGTGLKNVMKALSKSTGPAAAVFEKYNIETKDASKNIRNAIDVFEDLGVALKNVPTGPLLEDLTLMFGQISIDSAINLVAQAGAMRELRDEIASTTGITKEMADVMRDTVLGRMKALGSSVESIKLSIFGLNKGPFSDLLDNMTQFTRDSEQMIATGVTDFILKLSDNFDNIVGAAKIVGGLTVAILALNVALKVTAAITALINVLMGANPIALIVFSVIALGAAVGFAVLNWGKLKKIFTELPISLKILAGFLAIPLAPLIAMIAIPGEMLDRWGVVGPFFVDMWEGIKNTFKSGVDAVKGLTNRLLPGFLPGLSFLKNSVFGNGGSEQGQSGSTTDPQIVSPQERVSRSIQESRSTETTEVILRAEPGTSARIMGASSGSSVQLQPSGGF